MAGERGRAPLPPEVRAKLERLLRTRGIAATARLLRTAPSTVDMAIIGNLQPKTLERLTAALAAVA